MLDEIGKLSEYLATSGDFDPSLAKLQELAPFGVAAVGPEFFNAYVSIVNKYLRYFDISTDDALLAQASISGHPDEAVAAR